VEGDIVDSRVQGIHIAPTSVEVEDGLYKKPPEYPMTQGPKASQDIRMREGTSSTENIDARAWGRWLHPGDGDAVRRG